ncbi:MAG: putative bifunctional diguanylate cyclase/phosphodiesterase [Gammaproteobacteria bacterium]
MNESITGRASTTGGANSARVATWQYDARQSTWSWPSGTPGWLPEGTADDLHTLVAHTDAEHGAKLTRALSGRDAFRVTLPVATSSKSVRWINIEGSRNGYGDVSGLIHDVTQNRRVEDALRAEIARYRRAAQDGNAVMFTARLPDWRMGHVSDSIEQLTGYPRQTWLSQPDFLRQITLRDDRPRLSPATLRQTVEAGEPLRFQIRRADGRVVTLRANLRVRQTPDKRRAIARGVLMADAPSTVSTSSEREQHARILFDQNPAMFFCISPDGLIESVNRYGAEHLGYRPDELVTRDALDLHLPSQRAQVAEYVRHCKNEPGVVHHWETCLVRKDGCDLWVRVAARLVDADGQSELLIVCEDITYARRLSEKLRYQENFDLLTGLANRRRFERELTAALVERDESGANSVLCYLDLDHFKVINETCGHDVGDQLLLKVSRLLSRHVRECDALARLGGDEFAILFRGCPLVDARRRAEEICLALASDRFEAAGQSFRATGSIGVVDLATTQGTQAQLLSFADSACFTAKDQGRNRVVYYTSDDLEIVRRQGEMAWVSRLQKAVDDDLFELFYQPIRSLSRDPQRGRAMEVLLRLPDATDDTFVRPDEFLRAAENYQLAVRIDAWVCDHVLRYFAANPHAADGLDLCCINLSSQSLTDTEFLTRLVRRIGPSNPLAKKICFEITETGVIANLELATEFINTLKALGCRFALDDFGSGVSSFAYLKSLPVDVVKIDGMFVRNMASDPIDRALVASINDIAHAMGKLTVAEYVEDESVVGRLEEMGVDYAQGFYLAKPAPLRDYGKPGDRVISIEGPRR